MPTARDNFKAWYAQPIRTLSPNRDFGMAVALIAFPLLERYIRQKIGLPGHSKINDAFLDELVRLVPEMQSRDVARKFWPVYRHGLLHEVSPASVSRSGVGLPTGALTHDLGIFSIDAGGSYYLNPAQFAERVLQTIESDFSTYEVGSKSATPLPTEQQLVFSPQGSTALGPTILTTKS
jgi:hypothetical protein